MNIFNEVIHATDYLTILNGGMLFIFDSEEENRIRKSERTVKSKVALLKEKGHIRRLNGKQNGQGEILSTLE